ncbi:T9SS type A sorting domain-containing protein [Bacteroidota bacterium]
MRKKLFSIGIPVILLLLFTSANAQNVGEKAPDFSYSDLEGKMHSLSAYAGKVVFIYTFGNGCPTCKDVGDETEKRVQAVFGGRSDFQALGLDTWDNSSSTATVGSFKSITGITYPLLLKAGSFEPLYSTTYDRVLVIDQAGVLRHKNNKSTASDLDNAIAVIESLVLPTGVNGPNDGLTMNLRYVYPNPAKDHAGIRFTMKASERVNIRIYNPLGQEVKRIVDGVFPAGEHSRDFSTADLSPGVYLISMETAGNFFSRKMQVSR